MAPRHEFRRGQEVVVIGHPGVGGQLTLKNALSRGLLSTQTEINGQPVYQLNISSNPGNLGGPVFDATRQVIGVVSARARKEEAIGFCIPLEDSRAAMERALKQTDQGAAELTARHNFDVVFIRLAVAGAFYGEAMQLFTERMREATRDNRPPDAGIALARSEIGDSLKKLDLILIDDIKGMVAQLSKNEAFDRATRDKLAELWTTYREVKSYVDNPRGTVASYADKTHALVDQHKRLVEHLKLTLGIDHLDLDFYDED